MYIIFIYTRKENYKVVVETFCAWVVWSQTGRDTYLSEERGPVIMHTFSALSDKQKYIYVGIFPAIPGARARLLK